MALKQTVKNVSKVVKSIKIDDEDSNSKGSDMVKVSEKLPGIYKKYYKKAKKSASPQKCAKELLKGMFSNKQRAKMSAGGSKINPSIDDLMVGYSDIREGLKEFVDSIFDGNYPMEIVNGWINGSAGDARRQIKDSKLRKRAKMEPQNKKN